MNGDSRMASLCAALLWAAPTAEAAPVKKPRTCVEICQMLTVPGGRNDYSFCMSRCIAHAYSRRTETLAPRPGARPESATGRDPPAHRRTRLSYYPQTSLLRALRRLWAEIAARTA